MARALGDESLLASLRSLEAGGRESAELEEGLIERESHLSDATLNVLHIKPHRV